MDIAWEKKKEDAPHIVKLVHRFNSLSFSISYMICTCRELKERASIITCFISLAQVSYCKHG